jgi:peroxiredoxin
MTAFDVERDDLLGMHGVSERAAFVIDRDGMIQYAWVGENPGVFPPMEEIRAAVRELK